MRSNKKLGNSFENEFCELLYQNDFWVHNLVQNASGQPADVIAVKDGKAYLIDCKVCTADIFALARIEDNQELAMRMWRDCGNGEGWFALKFSDGIYMVDRKSMANCQRWHSRMDRKLAETYGRSFEEWLAWT